MLNCHSGLLSGNSLGCSRCYQSCHEPENNGITLTSLSPYPPIMDTRAHTHTHTHTHTHFIQSHLFNKTGEHSHQKT